MFGFLNKQYHKYKEAKNKKSCIMDSNPNLHSNSNSNSNPNLISNRDGKIDDLTINDNQITNITNTIKNNTHIPILNNTNTPIFKKQDNRQHENDPSINPDYKKITPICETTAENSFNFRFDKNKYNVIDDSEIIPLQKNTRVSGMERKIGIEKGKMNTMEKEKSNCVPTGDVSMGRQRRNSVW